MGDLPAVIFIFERCKQITQNWSCDARKGITFSEFLRIKRAIAIGGVAIKRHLVCEGV
jgi:hypothetical protein